MKNSEKMASRMFKIVDGHDMPSEGRPQRTQNILLVTFVSPYDEPGAYEVSNPDMKYTGSRYFGLPCAVPDFALDGEVCCLNVVDKSYGQQVLSTCSGAGPDVNMNGMKCSWEFDERGGWLTRHWTSYKDEKVTEKFRFNFLDQKDVDEATNKWRVKEKMREEQGF